MGDGRRAGRLECIWYSAVPSIYLSAGCLVWSGLLVVSPCVLPRGLSWCSRQTMRVCLVACAWIEVGCKSANRSWFECVYILELVWGLHGLTQRQGRPLLSVSVDSEALVDKMTVPRFVASIKLWQLPGVGKLHQGHTFFSSFCKCVTLLVMEGGSLETLKENIFTWLDTEPGT